VTVHRLYVDDLRQFCRRQGRSLTSVVLDAIWLYRQLAPSAGRNVEVEVVQEDQRQRTSVVTREDGSRFAVTVRIGDFQEQESEPRIRCRELAADEDPLTPAELLA
jgi:hypothetical protein